MTIPRTIPGVTRRHQFAVQQVSPKADRTYQGVVYDSKAEMLYADYLDVLEKEGELRWWRAPKCRLGCAENVYTPDFLIHERAGRSDVYMVDVKGCKTRQFKKNKRLWAKYGKCPLHVVKCKGRRWETTIIEGGLA